MASPALPIRSLRHARRLLRTAAAVLALLPACAWNPWIPGERKWNPDIVVDPGALADPLALDTRHVDTLSCYTPLCSKRFRVVVTEAGTLALSLIPELRSSDAQVRIVLEGIEGVLGGAGTGRGPHTDVPALAVSERVGAGVYFVLIEALGGPVPYQLTARLTPGAGPAPPPARRPRPAEEAPATLVAVPEASRSVRAGYDPRATIPARGSFSFPAPAAPGDEHRPGAPVESPLDRVIRRSIADELERRGFHQASGGETAELLVGFSSKDVNRDFYGLFSLYDRYGFGIDTNAWALGSRVATRSVLVLDIVDAQSERLAWHAVVTTGLGPGITPGAHTEAVWRQAVTEALLGFPPN
ncbi:MAG: DUF4136 domain-containing protein [Deltaproteobacteria bacterium]|nr:DUF4136 domain-containing protein [Deltaproteobacteria bacterium]